MIKNIIFDLEGVLLEWEGNKNVIWYKEVLELLPTLSDFDLYYLTNILPRSGTHFDSSIKRELKNIGFVGGLASHKSKYKKPQKEFYYELIDNYNIISSESIFIDDKKLNIYAANKIGMKGILNKPGKTNIQKEIQSVLD
jgi:HAD superfamily hydrolase (TIGR01509 family)